MKFIFKEVYELSMLTSSRPENLFLLEVQSSCTSGINTINPPAVWVSRPESANRIVAALQPSFCFGFMKVVNSYIMHQSKITDRLIDSENDC